MSFFAELKRRNVFKVGVAYAIVAWLLIQIGDVLFQTFQAPDWAMRVFTLFVILGFPLALFFAWAFELTPEGIKPTSDVDKTQSITQITGQKLNYTIIALLAFALIYVLVDDYIFKNEKALPTTPSDVKQAETSPVLELAAAENKKSIAVLPFANRSDSKEDTYFVDGIQDDILTQLAKITSLKVISRTSVMGYRNTTKNMKTIGNELGVATLLEGGVQRAGKQIRINVQLIDADRDEHLWAETYNRELTAENIFSIQSEISTSIANALRATLSLKEQERLKAIPTRNLEALEAYFKGKQQLVARTSEGLEQAVAYFQQAVDLDPNFDLAYVGLADAYQLQYNYSGMPKAEMSARAQFAIDKALSLNDELGEAYASLGLLKENNYEFTEAETAFEKALQLNPNYAAVYNWYGNLKSEQNKSNEALAIFRKGAELDPLSVVLSYNIAVQLNILGRFQESLQQFDKTIEIAPNSPSGYQGKGSYYWSVTGQLDEAAKWLHKTHALDPKNPSFVTLLAFLYWDLGDDGQAGCWARRAETMAPESYQANNVMLMLNTILGDATRALSYAQKAVQIESRDNYPDALAVLRDHDIQAGNFEDARNRYEQSYPELFSAEPRIGYSNLRAAIDLAALLLKTDEQERAEQLLSTALEYINKIQRLGWDGYGISDVAIYALQGNKQKALDALRQAVDAGWRIGWRAYLVDYDANMASIRSESQFKAILAEIKSDMAAQLTRAREQETDICK